MNPQDAIDLGREAIKACFLVGGPILLASLIIGLLVGVLQAMTQVQDQTVSFVPKLLCLILVIGICLPWLTEKLVDFSRETLSTPMTHLHRTPTNYSVSVQPASFARRSGGSTSELKISVDAKVGSDLDPQKSELLVPDKLPFQLPHYRYSKLPSAAKGEF